ncbi:MAG: hypothetical protein BWY50_01505 [Spirochaetes bacterium ADurb.Bin315]|nr:MAG: hypothetical protein BWY50_01505 [Spirochaetes bacterium ADurb.Bin315]
MIVDPRTEGEGWGEVYEGDEHMHFFDGGHFDAEEGDEIDDFAGFGERFEVIGAVMVAEAEDVNSFLFRFDRQQKGGEIILGARRKG